MAPEWLLLGRVKHSQIIAVSVMVEYSIRPDNIYIIKNRRVNAEDFTLSMADRVRNYWCLCQYKFRQFLY